MTSARELAQKIVAFGEKLSDEGGSSRRMVDWLESLLKEALKENYKNREAAWKSNIDVAIEQARAEERKACAKLISDECLKEEFPDTCRASIRAINKIRRRLKA